MSYFPFYKQQKNLYVWYCQDFNPSHPDCSQ